MYQSDLVFYPDSGRADGYRFGRITVSSANNGFVIVYEPNPDVLRLLTEKFASDAMRSILNDLATFLNSERRHIAIKEGMAEPDVLIAVTRVLPENIHITTPVETRPKNTVEFAEQRAEFVIA